MEHMRGNVYQTTEGTFKLVRKESNGRYIMKEVRYSLKNGKQTGLYQHEHTWTEAELDRAVKNG